MAEKLAEVFEQYDMDIVKTFKGRGATILTTAQGHRILEPFRGNITRLEQEHVLKKLFVGEGFTELDGIIPNRDGQLLSCDRYRQPYVLKRHFDGEECDMRELSDVLRGIRVLARLHICGKAVAFHFSSAWEQHEREKEEKKLSEIRKAFEDGEELERLAHIYDIRETILKELLKKSVEPEEGEAVSKEVADREASEPFYKDVIGLFLRHNKELKKIYKYIGTVKRKNTFETLVQQVFAEFYQQGRDCVTMLEEQNVARQVYEKHYGICHGSYNQHNVLLFEEGEAVVHFERFSKGNQLDDLYQFSRKVMEKNHFDLTFLEAILEEYSRMIPLDREDYRYIYVLFSYPEKFWKIANSYYNTNKAFLSPKYVEKLEAVIEQEKEKREMLEKFSAVHLKDI